jgi:hypothetical protein
LDCAFGVGWKHLDEQGFHEILCFERKSLVESVVTLEEGLHHAIQAYMISFHIWLSKNSIHTFAKQCSHVVENFPYFIEF